MIRRFLVGMSVIAAVLGVLLHLLQLRQAASGREEVFRDALFLQESMARQIRRDLAEARADLKYLAGRFQDRFPDLDGSAGPEVSRLQKELVLFSREKVFYDQIRLLDRTGRELLRINYNDGDPRPVPPHRLQNKSHRYYVGEAFRRPAGRVYTSPFDLNLEHKRVEVPLKPMVRLGLSLFGPDGSKAGLLLLNYHGRRILDDLRQAVRGKPSRVLLLNRKGYYLIGPTRDQEWGFMFPKGDNRTFRAAHPDAWDTLSNDGVLKQSGPQGLYLLSTLGRIGGGEPRHTGDDCRECGWILGLWVPPEHLSREAGRRLARLSPVFFGMLAAFGIAYGLLLLINRHKKRAEDEVDLLNRSIAAERDAFVGGPTIVFKWRNQFGWPVEYVSANVLSVLGYPAERFVEQEITYSGIIAPEFLPQVAEENRALSQGDRNWVERGPYQAVDAGGRRLWLRETTSVVRNAEGRITHFIGYLNDITALKETERKLRETGRYVQTVIDTMPDPTIVIDVATHAVSYANEAARQIYDLPKDFDAAPRTCYGATHGANEPCSGKDDPCPIRMIQATRRSSRIVHRHKSARGTEMFVEVVGSPVVDDAGEIVQIIESHRDVTEQLRERDRLKTEATIDPLTGCHNRRMFDTVLEKRIGGARTYDAHIGLVMFDIDHFKRINDTHGHEAGDDILKELSALVRGHTRRNDLLVRWGGEEFMLLTSVGTPEVAARIAESLRRKVEVHRFPRHLKITISLGATVMAAGEHSADLLRRVDEALYESKAGGRNRVTVIEADPVSADE